MSQRTAEAFGEFPTTHWSLVQRAGMPSDEAQRQALTEILKRYLPALRSHLVVRQCIRPEEADDHLQSFLSSKVLEQGIIQRARQEKGKFRSFLLVALDRFVVSEMRRRRAKKRSPDQLMPLEEELDVPAVSEEPCADFDVAWARELLHQAITQMAAECKGSGRPDIWGVFEARILAPLQGNAAAAEYDELVKRFGFTSPSQASNVLMTAKRMFIRTLRSLIGEYQKSEEEIDQEIQDLQEILAGAK